MPQILMPIRYDAVLFDLFGTLVDETAAATPGANERLEEARGVPSAIVTSAGARLASQLLLRAGLQPPPVVICGDDVRRNKPAPDGYREAARRLGVEPARALVIEDSADGIAAGVAAGCDVLALLYGRTPGFARSATYAAADLTKLRLLVEGGAVRLELEGRVV